jgi:ABC-type sugar transport system permease subunit
MYLLPAIIPIIIFGYIPAVQALSLCFITTKGRFVGLQNFIAMAQDKVLIASARNMLIMLVAGLVTGNVPSFIMAECLFNLRSKRNSAVYRFLFIIPMMIPGIVIMLVWQYMMLDPINGLANAILGRFGIPPLAWLGEVRSAIPSLLLFGFPWMAGTSLLIYLAGIQGIPDSVIESSLLDGAGILRRIFRIDIPLIIGQLKLLLILGVIGGVQGFGLQLMTTNGGPAYATMVPGLWMYLKAFKFGDYSYASAIGMVIFLIILFFTYLNMKYIRSESN